MSEAGGVANQHRLLAIIGVLLLYFGGEALLRRRIYYVPVSHEPGRLLGSLPSLIRDPIERQRKEAELKDQLEVAKEPGIRMQILYDLSDLAEGDDRLALLRRISAENTTDPAAARANAAVMATMDPEQAVQFYLDFIHRARIKSSGDRLMLWEQGWRGVGILSEAAKYAYLKALVEQRIVHGSLVPAYEELRSIASRQRDDQLMSLAKDLRRRSEELRDKTAPK